MQKSVLEYLEQTLMKHGNKTAVIDEHQSLNFEELACYSQKLGLMLAERVFKKPIAVLLPKSANSLIAFLGILYSGNFYVPIDVKSPSTRVRSILDDLGNPLVITNRELCQDYDEISKEQVVLIETVFEVEDKDEDNTLFYGFEELVDTDPVYPGFPRNYT